MKMVLKSRSLIHLDGKAFKIALLAWLILTLLAWGVGPHDLMQPLASWKHQRLANVKTASVLRNALASGEGFLEKLECYSFECVIRFLNESLHAENRNVDILFSYDNHYEKEFIEDRLQNSVLQSPDFMGMSKDQQLAELKKLNRWEALDLIASFFPAEVIIYEKSIRLSISEAVEEKGTRQSNSTRRNASPTLKLAPVGDGTKPDLSPEQRPKPDRRLKAESA